MAILVKRGIPHLALPPVLCEQENIAIQLTDHTIIRGVYNSPRIRLTERDLTSLTQGDSVLVVGDFNARHTAWRNRNNNTNGGTLYRFVQEEGMTVCGTETPTHYPRNGTTPTYIDLIVNKNYRHQLEPVTKVALNSDHSPVWCSIRPTQTDKQIRKSFDYSSTNWREFRRQVTDNIQINNRMETKQDIDDALDELTHIITTARNRTTRQRRMAPFEERIPDDIQNLIKFKNKIKKRWHRHRRPLDKRRLDDLQQTITNKLNDYNNDKWNAKIESLSTSDNTIWKMTKLLRKPFNPVPALVVNNRPVMDDGGKAEAIADTLERTYVPRPNTIDRHDEIQRDMEDMPPYFRVGRRDLLKLYTTPSEIKEILKYLQNNRAPGRDTIPNLVLKNLPRKGIVQLCYIFNACVRLQYFPDRWKIAVVLPFRKPGKPAESPNSYRPIALLDTMSKLFEKIIHKRLTTIINELGLVPRQQFGFRSGCSTVHALARLVQDAIHAFNKKQTTTALFLDVEKAFDTVWHEGLLHKLKNLPRFPAHLVTLLRSYLTDRRFAVKVNNSLSEERAMMAGVPQGTVLSPLLYSLYLSEIPTSRVTRLLQFADDTAIYSHSCTTQTAIQKIKNNLPPVLNHLEELKVKVNPSKTELLTMTRRFTGTRITSNIRLDDRTVREQRTAKYLGVTLDRWLTFKPHITNTIQKTFMTITKLYPLLNRRSKLSTHNKLLLFKTIIRPTMIYGAPIWHNTSKTQMKRLQTTQNKILRLVTNADRYANLTDLHNEYRIPKIDDYIKATARKFFRHRVQTSEMTADLLDIRQGNDQLRHTHKYLHDYL